MEFGLRTVDETLARTQSLWEYVAGEWLTFRRPTGNQLERQWPIDPVWEDVRGIRLAPGSVAVIRQRLQDAEEERLIQGGLGYISSWAALRDHGELDKALEAIRPILVRYLERKGSTFRDEVKRKRDRRLEVSEPGEESVA